MSKFALIPRLRADAEHSRMVIGDISALLRRVGLPAPEDMPQEPGESLASARARRLEALQPYSHIWDKHRLDRLSLDQLDVAEAQIIEAAYHHAVDIVCAIERLFLEGNDAPMVSRVLQLPLALVSFWMPQPRGSH
jgi:hypothetical protein